MRWGTSRSKILSLNYRLWALIAVLTTNFASEPGKQREGPFVLMSLN